MHRSPKLISSWESLEGRRLLSASIVDGVLMVEGTQQSDKMAISLNHDDHTKLDVVVNGETTSFTLADITGGVSMNALGGKDKMNVVEEEGAITLNVTMKGGSGRDIMHGGSGDDDMNGGNGKDSMDGGAGNDNLFGGNGNDELLGGAGDDKLAGGRGNDKLDGGEGDDDLDGGKGEDRVKGGGGNDDFSSHDNSSELVDRRAEDKGNNRNDHAKDEHDDAEESGDDVVPES